MLSPQGVFRWFLKGHFLRTDWREVCSLSEGQETVSQWMRRFDDLIKPRAKSAEDYLHALGLINLFGSHLRFGAETRLQLRVQIPLATHSEYVHTRYKQQTFFFFFLHHSTHSVSSRDVNMVGSNVWLGKIASNGFIKVFQEYEDILNILAKKKFHGYAKSFPEKSCGRVANPHLWAFSGLLMSIYSVFEGVLYT